MTILLIAAGLLIGTVIVMVIAIGEASEGNENETSQLYGNPENPQENQ